MTGICQLLEIFRGENKGPQQLFQSLRSDAAGPGLRSFLSILRHGIGFDADGKPGVECWSRPQIEATLSVAKLIVSASVAAPVDHAEPVVLAIIESSLELCTCLLERSKFEGDDISFQVRVFV
ncbi:hypothetical protein Taro_019319, partial [Colocasia esculenta]|nr:hypothetical protein [Colocasia esculenta]